MDPLFSPPEGKKEDLSSRLTSLLDDACMSRNKSQAPRKYLGASRWGHHCERALGYEYHQVPKDEGSDFKGKTIRIFDMGHDGEDRMAEYLKAAGFLLVTHNPDGKQFGFEAAGGRLKGHLDGIIHGGPDLEGLKWPALWENKALGSKSFKDVVSKGIKEAKYVYWAQAQTYMAHLNLECCLFTCLNRDTGEVYAEVIRLDTYAAQQLIDKAVRIISSQTADELTKFSQDPSNFGCKFCDYKARCHAITLPQPTQNTSIPSWLK